jgi:hypothetical protein
MHATERPEAAERGTMTAEEALRLLANTRRTLLKLVSNIDEAIGTVNGSQDGREERAPIAR